MRQFTFIFLLAILSSCSSVKNKEGPKVLVEKKQVQKITAGTNLFALHELLSKNDLNNFEQNLDMIPESIQLGVEKQLRTLVSRLGIQNSTTIYGYNIPKKSLEKFFQQRERKRILSSTDFAKIHQEEWLIGGNYEVCGFQGVSVVFQLVPESPKVNDIDSCLTKETSYVKILDIDKEWIFFQFENRPHAFSEQEDPQEATKEIKNNYTYRTSRRTLTTPIVVSDGQIDIALLSDGVSEIRIGKKSFKTFGKYECSSREEGIKIIEEKEDYVDHHFDSYLFPKNFDRTKIFIRLNSPEFIYHSEYCEGGC